MLDMKFIRESPDAVRRGAAAKNIPIELDTLLALDERRRSAQTQLQALVTEQNQISRDIGPLMGQLKKTTDAAAKASLEARIQSMRQRPTELKLQTATLEEQIKQLEPQLEAILLTIPQPPDEDVPAGKTAEENVELRRWGRIPAFDFTPRGHVELGQQLKLFDLERGVKLAGSRSYFLMGAGALLHQAVLRLAMDMMVYENGFTPVSVPVLVKEPAMRGTGFFPAGREQAYRVGEINESGDDERFLTGTGEVGLTAMYMDEILDYSQLPIKLVTQSTCFRREAGTYGKDTSGLYRIHQFDKVEQVIICKADRAESISWHQRILANSEALLQRLNLPYRVMQCCTGDLGPKNASMVDIETWMPSRQAYGETHSASRLYDFQARRCNLRFRDENGKVHFCHTLNNTVAASPRILIPILELYQNADGSVRVPDALVPYMGGLQVIA